MSAYVELENVRKVYKMGEVEIEALKDATFGTTLRSLTRDLKCALSRFSTFNIGVISLIY